MGVEALVDDFGFFETWEERYAYLIELGKQLPPMRDEDKTDANRVRGCISQVWVVPRAVESSPRRLEFDADSDSAIVRGLVAIARALFHGRTRAEIEAVDLDDVLRKLGFDAHLSVNRRNGFQSLVATLKLHAAAL